jgi:redox-sensitive bicupin YhaK (pirin superfamily)
MNQGLEALIVPPVRDLGDGFKVRRALPSAERRMVGPFVFLDQMGPTVLAAGRGLDVRPHPHIGLATVTYLFEGEILHRDSLGSVQAILPGELNWMTAGSGIVHSERTDQALRKNESALFGLQSWVALPRAHEETGPAFEHVSRDRLPTDEGEGVSMRVVAGSFLGKRSPVGTLSDLFYADLQMQAGKRVEIPADYTERGIYTVDGQIEVDGENFEAGRLLVLKPGATLTIGAGSSPARVVVLGGEPLDGPRFVHWNFVSSSKERIEQAREDWKAQRFAQVPGETEFIPLPEDRR